MADRFDELRGDVEKGHVAVIVGAGVSIAATDRAAVASWKGLLLSGVAECVEVAQPLPKGWEERVRAEIESGDLDDLLSAASKVESKLGGREGGDFARWLKKTIGALKVSASAVPEALRDLGAPLLTTNYDDVLEEVTRQPALTWRDGAQVEHVLRGEVQGIVHLHGYWRRPDTVILGLRSYEDVLRDAHAQAMQQAARAMKTLLFVGFGGGLEDPNFSALLKWSREVMKSSPYVCYRLARESEVEGVRRQHTRDERIRVLSYGKSFDDLPGFLRGLIPTGRPAGRPVLAVPVEGEPPRPRVLVAGPLFGVPQYLHAELAGLMGGPLTTRQKEEVQRKLDRDEVRLAHIAAIVRHDVVIDVSPWRAFDRWHSLGFRDTEVGGAEREGTTGLGVFAATEGVESGVPVPRLDRFAERWPELYRRVSSLASRGLTIAGFSEGPSLEWGRHLASLWPEAEVLGELCLKNALPGRRVYQGRAALDGPLLDATLEDYLRALKVVAGQVRLVGELRLRPIEDVFVEMEISRPVPTVRRIHDERKREEDRNAEPARDGGELADELATREAERKGGIEVAQAGRVLDMGLGPRILLWGNAGKGKSTLLRWLACQEAARGGIPLWLTRLRVLGADPASELVEQALEAVGLPRTGSPVVRQQLQEALIAGKARLFLDALDEAGLEVQASLLGRLGTLGAGLQALVSSRPIGTEVAGGFVQVDLLGLGPRGPEKFLRAYFGHGSWEAALLREIRQLADGEQWLRTPVLLSLAAALYARERRLPEATLELYERVVAALLEKASIRWGFQEEEVARERKRLTGLARSMLLPREGEARAAIRTIEVAGGGSDFLRTCGLLATDGAWMRFIHLSLGEFLAAQGWRPEELRDERARWRRSAKGSLALDALPMAHALAGGDALEDALREVDLQGDESDHRMLALLLRAIGYGGEKVSEFCEKNSARVIVEVLKRMQLPSGRFAEEEQALVLHAERAFRVLGLRAGGRVAEVEAALVPLLKLPGDIGTEAHILAWVGGLREPGMRNPRDPALALRVVLALLRAGATPEWVIRKTRGPSSTARAAAAQALVGDAEARPLLRELLRDDAWRVRVAAAQALVDDADARPLLRELLRDEDSDVRAAAAQALAGDIEARPLLREWLRDEDSDMRAAAAQALVGDPEARPLLRELLRDEDADVRAAAARALAGDVETRPLLRELLRDGTSGVRAAAAQALAGDAEARPLLREWLHDDSWRVRAAAAQALAGDVETRPLLRELLRDGASGVRAAAAQALAGDVETWPLLRGLLLSDAWRVRAAAAQALAGDVEARPLLRELLRDEEPDVQAAAAQALVGDSEALPRLRELLRDGASGVRAAAAQALAGDAETRSLLCEWLRDEDSNVRAAAAQALAGDAEARPLLRELLLSDTWRVRAAAAQALVGDVEARPLLREWLREDAWRVRAAAAQVLTGDVESWPLLRELLRDKDSDVRAAAAQALTGDVEAQPLLRELLSDEEPNVRAVAAQALVGDAEARPLLRELLSDEDSDVRAAAAQALAGDAEARLLLRGCLGDEDPESRAAAALALAGDAEARPLLRELLRDENSDVRAAAAQALAGDAEARPLLREWLRDENSNVRFAAAQVLASDAEVRPMLHEWLRDGAPGVRAVAAKMLAGDISARPMLREWLRDGGSGVRAAAAEALAGDTESRPLLRELLFDDAWRVRAAAAQALSGDAESRPQLRELLRDDVLGVRAAAAQALASDVESCSALLPLLGDQDADIRQIAAQAVRASSADAGVRPEVVPALAPALRLGGLADISVRLASTESLLLEERLRNFVEAPHPLHLSKESVFAEALLGWLCLRLLYTFKSGVLSPGSFFGELTILGDSDRLSAPGNCVLMRVSMHADVLSRERLLHVHHNLMEAWRVARHLRADTPPAVLLACADVSFVGLQEFARQKILPALRPGDVCLGPVFFGFRIAQGQPLTGDFSALLLTSAHAERLWKDASSTQRASQIDMLTQLAEHPELDPWSLVPLLGRIGQQLPPGLQAALVRRLPAAASEGAILLERAAQALGKTAPSTIQVQTNPSLRPAGEFTSSRERLAHALQAIRETLQTGNSIEPAIAAFDAVLPLLSGETPAGDLSEVVRLIDRLRDRASTREQGQRLSGLALRIQQLPLPREAAGRLSDVLHRINLFLHAYRR